MESSFSSSKDDDNGILTSSIIAQGNRDLSPVSRHTGTIPIHVINYPTVLSVHKSQ